MPKKKTEENIEMLLPEETIGTDTITEEPETTVEDSNAISEDNEPETAESTQESTDLLLTVDTEDTVNKGLSADSIVQPEEKLESSLPSEADPPKAKRTTRRKKTPEPVPEEPAIQSEDIIREEPEAPIPAVRNASRRRTVQAPILTVDVGGEAETHETRDDIIWHEIRNAYRTRKILTGNLGGIEQTEDRKTLAIVDYKGFRIVIPLKEMMINLGRSPSGAEYEELMRRQNKILGNMLGAEIDFIVRGIDSKSRSVVASRQEAMLKKRQLFYFNTDSSGSYRIYDGRIVQARVIAVGEKVIRVEVFGVETSIMARDLAWDWIGDAHERFSVGDQILVRVLSVNRSNPEELSIRADVKSVSENSHRENLKKCRIQSKYAGKVTDVHKGIVYIRLSNGVNAVAHSCYDRRMPGKKDDVSFAVTKIDEERGVAVGIITRIIRQNL